MWRPDHQTLSQRNAQVSEQQGKHHPVAHGDDEFDLLSGLGDMFRHLGPGGKAGRQMGMSYRRAWLLVDSLNRCFNGPVVLG
jgi:molybdate transport system regulatory protein